MTAPVGTGPQGAGPPAQGAPVTVGGILVRVVLETLAGTLAGLSLFMIFHGAEWAVERYADALPLKDAEASTWLRGFLSWAGAWSAAGTLASVLVYEFVVLVRDLRKAFGDQRV